MSFELNKDLPQSWERTSIGDITLPYETAQPTKEPEKEFKYIDIGSIENYNQTITNPKTFLGKDAPSRARRVVKKGDILFSTVRTYLNNIARVPVELDGVLTSTGIAVLRSTSKMNSSFLFYFVLSDEFIRKISSAMDGTLYPAVTDNDVTSAEIIIPPLNEQRRIVAKIEALKARSQRVKEALEAIPSLLDQFRESVLAAAFRGDLTADWREKNSNVEPASILLERICAERRRRWEEAELEKMKASGKVSKDDKWKEKYQEPKYFDLTGLPELPNSWCWADFQSIAIVKDPNPSHRYPSYEGGTVPILSTREFQGLNDWLPESPQLVTEEFYQYQNRICNFSPNDIIFARKGKIGLARRPPKLLKYTFSHTVFVIKCFDGIFSESILWCLRQNQLIEWLLREMNSNNGVPTLGKAIIERTPIPLAPLAEQQEIVSRVEAFFKAADNIEQQYREVKTNLDQLDQSILAKAFRGELVPQDPNDEPASVLLERIRAERAQLDTKTKTAKKSPNKTGDRRKKPKPQDAEPVQLELGLE